MSIADIVMISNKRLILRVTSFKCVAGYVLGTRSMMTLNERWLPIDFTQTMSLAWCRLNSTLELTSQATFRMWCDRKDAFQVSLRKRYTVGDVTKAHNHRQTQTSSHELCLRNLKTCYKYHRILLEPYRDVMTQYTCERWFSLYNQQAMTSLVLRGCYKVGLASQQRRL